MTLEKPMLHDIPRMQALIRDEVEQGIILERSDDEMANAIRSYIVAREGEEIIGFCALYVYTMQLAEIRSLYVSDSHRGRGVGREIVNSALQEAHELGVKEVLVLTYKQRFFEHLGFGVISKGEVPEQKIWADCIKCKLFPLCEEISLLKRL